jgi:hypothetical protein
MLDQAVYLLQRDGVAEQVHSWEQLGTPILAYGPPNPLHQFLAAGLQEHRLAFWQPLVNHIHDNLFSC